MQHGGAQRRKYCTFWPHLSSHLWAGRSAGYLLRCTGRCLTADDHLAAAAAAAARPSVRRTQHNRTGCFALLGDVLVRSIGVRGTWRIVRPFTARIALHCMRGRAGRTGSPACTALHCLHMPRPSPFYRAGRLSGGCPQSQSQ